MVRVVFGDVISVSWTCVGFCCHVTDQDVIASNNF
jgi:hypothetical protein